MEERLNKRTVAAVIGEIQAQEKADNLHGFLKGLPVADHRVGTRVQQGPLNIYDAPGRVRLFDAKTPTGTQKVILKFVHGGGLNLHANRYSKETGEERPAHLTVGFIHNVVALNQRALDADGKPIREEQNYRLKKPIAYPVHAEIALMAPTRLPEVTEMLPTYEPTRSTERGRKKLGQLKRLGITEEQLLEAAKQAEEHTGIHPTNLVVHGYRNGKFTFMPRIDLY